MALAEYSIYPPNPGSKEYQPKARVPHAQAAETDGRMQKSTRTDKQPDRSPSLSDADKAVAAQEAGIVARAVQQDLRRAEQGDKEEKNVPVAADAFFPAPVPESKEKDQQDKKNGKGGHGFPEKRGEAPATRRIGCLQGGTGARAALPLPARFSPGRRN